MSGSGSHPFSDDARGPFLRSLLREKGYLPTPGTADVSIFGCWQSFCNKLSTSTPTDAATRPGEKSPAGTLRVIHQPDLLTGFNIAGLLELARIAADVAKVSVTFSALDYDTFANHRFRASMVPDIHGRACIRLGQLVPRADRRKVALAAVPVDPSVARTWKNMILPSARYWRRLLGRNAAPVASRWQLAEAEDQLTAHMNELCTLRPLTAAMTNGVKKLADLCFGYSPDTYSVAGLVSSANESVIALAREALRCNADLADRLVWRICFKCHERAAAILVGLMGTVRADWRCANCGESGSEPLDFTADADNAILPKHVPQVMLCDLIDHVIYPATAAISYAGGVSHALAARRMAVQIRDAALYPEFFWDPVSLFEPTIPLNIGPDIRSLWGGGKFSSWWYRLVYDPSYLTEVVTPIFSFARTGHCDER